MFHRMKENESFFMICVLTAQVVIMDLNANAVEQSFSNKKCF